MNTLDFTLSVAIIFIIIWLLILSFFIFTYLKDKKRLVKEAKNNGLGNSIEKILLNEEDLNKKNKELAENILKLENLAKLSITRIGFIRYNPFADTGSNQSFSIALLNMRGNGVIMTSLHSREENKVYSKPIKNEQSKYPLTDEEKEAIKRA